MLLTDDFRSVPDLTWDIALSCGVTHGKRSAGARRRVGDGLFHCRFHAG